MILYTGKKHFAPAHSDKQQGVAGSGAKDIVAGTTIFSISVGKARTFQLLKDGVVVWQQKLAHGSLFKLHPDTNKHFQHAVPPEEVGGIRYSVILRHIKQPSVSPYFFYFLFLLFCVHVCFVQSPFVPSAACLLFVLSLFFLPSVSKCCFF